MNIQKKDLWLLSAIVVFLVGVGFVVAYGGNQPNIVGHSYNEIQTCSNDQILKTNSSGQWECVAIPSGGGSGVTSLSAGTGILLSPNPITSTGTISVNTNQVQARVTGTCAAGSAIRVINLDGSVSCQAVAPTVCTYSGRTYTTGAKCCVADEECVCSSSGSWTSCDWKAECQANVEPDC